MDTATHREDDPECFGTDLRWRDPDDRRTGSPPRPATRETERTARQVNLWRSYCRSRTGDASAKNRSVLLTHDE